MCKLKVDDGKADTVTSQVYQVLSNHKLDMKRLVSLGSDSATVMMGKKPESVCS